MKKHLTFATGQVQLIGLLVVATIVGLIVFVLMPFFNKANEYARGTTCTSNQKQIALAISIYAQEHNETLPSSANFWSNIGTSGKILKCPSDKNRTINSYGQNSSINGMKLEKIDDPTATFLTADVLPNSGNVISIGNGDPRHRNRLIASHLDGHVSTIKAPASFVYAPNNLMKGLLKYKDIYTPDGKYNSAHWNLSRLDGDQKVPKGDQRSKLTYDAERRTVTLAAMGEKASAVAKVDLSAFYPKNMKMARDYWAFNANISFKKSIYKSGMCGMRAAIIFLDEKEKVIAAFYISREFEEGKTYERLLFNYDNNNYFPSAKSKIKTPTIVMYNESMYTADEWKNSSSGDFRRSAEEFKALSIAARNSIIYFTYSNWGGNVKIDATKTNWRKPATLKIVCFENGSDGATNAIELQNLRFVIK